MTNFYKWLASSPIASALKVATGAVLVWALENIGGFGLEPVIQVALIAALPVLINAINPEDERYGSSSSSSK